jgi:hypothetical protein
MPQPHPISLAIAVASAGAATSARAVTTWQTQMRMLVQQFPAQQPVLIQNGTFALTVTGTYAFTVQIGIFNFFSDTPGSANHGLGDWQAAITATGFGDPGALGVNPETSRLSPFDFGPATAYGGVLTDPTHISTIIALRGMFPTPPVPWPVGSPQPTAPPEFGAGAYADVYRFTGTFSTLAADRYVTITGVAGAIVAWGPFNINPPSGSDPGSVDFIGLQRSSGEGGANAAIDPFTVHILSIPSPSAAAPALGLLALARRRRR